MEIPVYRRQNTIPAKTGGVMVSPEKVAEPYRAEAKIGETISNIGFKAAELNNQYMAAEKRAERTLALQEIEVTLDAGFASVKETIKENSDHTKYDELVANKATEIRKQIDAIQDPIVKQGALLKWQKETQALQSYARGQKALLISQKSENLYLAKSARYIDEIARSTDEVKNLEKKMEIVQEGYALEKARTIQPGYTERHMLAFDKNVNTLKEAYKKDAESALKQKEVEAKEAIKLSREATGNEFVSRLVSGKLTRADVLKSNLEPTGENGKQYWINQIEQDEKKRKGASGTGSGETFKTDKVIEKNLYIGIQTEKDINKLQKLRYNVLNAYSSGKLSKSSADSLITDIDKKSQPEKEKQGLGDKIQKDIIIKRLDDDYEKGVLGEKGSDDAAQLLIDLSKSYEEWAARPENKGKPHLEWYQTVMKPYNEKTVKSLLKSPYQTIFGEGEPNPRRALNEMKGSEKSDPLGIR